MAPTTPMAPGRLYIFDYITNKADLDDQELNGKTNGVDFCYITCENIRGLGDQEGDLNYYPGGKGFHFRYDQDKGTFMAGSDHLTKTEFAAVKRYWKKHRDNGADPDYLVFYRAASNYYPFHDEDANETQYLRGWFKRIPYEGWDKNIQDLYGIKIDFKEVWS